MVSARNYAYRGYSDPYSVRADEMRFRAGERDSVEFGTSVSMEVRNNRCPNGNGSLKCPFAKGTCCGQAGFSQACCPLGYSCNRQAAGWHCSAGSDASTRHQPASRPVTTISPTIVVNGAGAGVNGGSNGASSGTNANIPRSSDDADSDDDNSKHVSGSDAANDAYKPKQNIIIVKNINVLTKGVATSSSLDKKEDGDDK